MEPAIYLVFDERGEYVNTVRNHTGLKFSPGYTYEGYFKSVPPVAESPLKGWKIERVDTADGVGIKVIKPSGGQRVFWRDGWKGEKNSSEVCAYEILSEFLLNATTYSKV